MPNQRSFSQILQAMKDPKITPGQDFSAGWESHLDPFGLAQLIAEVQPNTSYKVNLHKAYPVKRQPKVAIARPSHVLNELQSCALGVLMSYSPQLRDNFNLHELKSAYRLSVLKTHPDQGGNSETFQEVKKSYQILLPLVKN